MSIFNAESVRPRVFPVFLQPAAGIPENRAVEFDIQHVLLGPFGPVGVKGECQLFPCPGHAKIEHCGRREIQGSFRVVDAEDGDVRGYADIERIERVPHAAAVGGTEGDAFGRAEEHPCGPPGPARGAFDGVVELRRQHLGPDILAHGEFDPLLENAACDGKKVVGRIGDNPLRPEGPYLRLQPAGSEPPFPVIGPLVLLPPHGIPAQAN